ncbi:MAG: hypothetical protein R2856_11295 [Caldilineaceae bacterium]
MKLVETPQLKIVALTVEQMHYLLDDYQRLETELGLPQTQRSWRAACAL